MAWLSDAEYVLQQDIKEKKSAGRGAFHKKGGSKSKKCNFPSDYMTKKEKMAMNGPVMSYDPNKFYEMKEFKKLPMEYQVKYINSLLLRYDCGLKAIAEVVFNSYGPTLYTYFKSKGQSQYLNSTGTKGGHSKDAGRKRLEADVTAARTPKSAEEIQNGSVKDAPKELTLKGKIDQAVETVELYESRGMEMTPELINQIYEEKTGMSFALAMEHAGEPIGKVEKVEESEDGLKIFAKLSDEGARVLDGDSKKTEDCKDDLECKTFLITTNKLDDGILDMIHRLFDGRKYELTITVALKED